MSRVLLLEDEPNIARIIEFKLRREGHSVTWYEEVPPAGVDGADVIVAEAALAGVDRLLRGPRPLIVLFEHGDVATRARAEAAGAAAAVEKPFKPTVLARTVAEVASR